MAKNQTKEPVTAKITTQKKTNLRRRQSQSHAPYEGSSTAQKPALDNDDEDEWSQESHVQRRSRHKRQHVRHSVPLIDSSDEETTEAILKNAKKSENFQIPGNSSSGHGSNFQRSSRRQTGSRTDSKSSATTPASRKPSNNNDDSPVEKDEFSSDIEYHSSDPELEDIPYVENKLMETMTATLR